MREVVSVVASGNLKGIWALNDTQKILLFHLNTAKIVINAQRDNAKKRGKQKKMEDKRLPSL